MKAQRGGEGVAPTHSQPRRFVGVRDQYQAPAALPPVTPRAYCTGGLTGAQISPHRDSIPVPYTVILFNSQESSVLGQSNAEGNKFSKILGVTSKF